MKNKGAIQLITVVMILLAATGAIFVVSQVLPTLGGGGQVSLPFSVSQVETLEEDEGNVGLQVCEAGADELKDLAVWLDDPEPTTDSQMSGSTVYYINEVTGKWSSTTTVNNGYQNVTNVLNCNNPYSYCAVGQAGVAGAGNCIKGEIADLPEEVIELSSHNQDHLEIRMWDESAGSAMNVFYDGSAITNSTGFQDFNNTQVGSDAGLSAISVGSSGQVDHTIYLKAENGDQFFGEMPETGMRVFACIDQGTGSVWDEPSVEWNGVALTDMWDELHDEDKKAAPIKASEYCYELDQISSNQEKLHYTMTAGGGDPGTADSYIWYIFAETRSKSRQGNEFIEAAFTDATTKLRALTDTEEVASLNVSIS